MVALRTTLKMTNLFYKFCSVIKVNPLLLFLQDEYAKKYIHALLFQPKGKLII